MLQLLEVLRNGHLHRREEGQALVEYALILSLVSIAAIVVLGEIGTNVNTILTTVRDALAP